MLQSYSNPPELIRGIILSCIALLFVSGCSTNSTLSNSAEYPAVIPPDAVERYESSIALMLARNDEAAIDSFSSLSVDYPELVGPMINLGILYRRGGQPAEARRYFDAAIRVCGDCASAYNELGILERQLGEFEAAESAYRKAIAVDPRYPLAYLNLGVLYDLYQRRLDLALNHYESYVELSGDKESNEQVEKWIKDLRRRVAKMNRTAMMAPVQWVAG